MTDIGKTTKTIEAVVCSKCGVLCPTRNEFKTGFMAARHHGRFTSDKHKLSIQTVDGKTKMADHFGWIIADVVEKEVYGEKE